ncbi:protein-tyrosine phosphatase family protein [Ramlibacter sp. AN1133]|uniref:protein-tyrosine phosphatase family protein n=1 Tax=Ramlibacter sp. AN1133 TaxID=3133429 RepID=UPI0030BD18F5
MTLRRVRLPPEVPGQLWLGPMPGRFQAWSAFSAEAERSGLGLVVCLTPKLELAELSPDYHAAVGRGRLPFRWMHVPMRNFGLPEDPAAFRRDVNTIADTVRAGKSVLLHCAAGMGRTGTAAACVLKALGLDAQQAVQRVRDAGSNPQNAEQSGLVEWF